MISLYYTERMSELRPHCTSCASRKDSIFCELNSQHLTDLDSHKVTNTYKRGQTLFYEGNPGTGIFCIFSGKVKLSKNGGDGKETILRIAAPGDVLGYPSLLSGDTHYANAVALEDATVCFLDNLYFRTLVDKNPELAFRMLHKLGEEVIANSGRLADLDNKSVRQRLAQLLLSLAQAHGRKEAHGVRIDVPLSRAELGAMIGATPETIIRTLAQFQEEELLELQGKMLFVLDKRGLSEQTGIEA